MKNLFSEQTLLPFLEQFDFSLVLRADPPHYTVLVVSDQGERATGRRRAELAGRGLFDSFTHSPFDPVGDKVLRQILSTAVQDRQPVTLPPYERAASPEAAPAYYETVLKPIFGTDQAVAYILVTITDITRQELARQAVEQSEQRLMAVIRQAPVAIALYSSRDMVVEMVNERMLDLWGKSADIIGHRLTEAVPGAESQAAVTMMQSVFDTGLPYYGPQFPATVWHDGQQQDGFFDLVCTPVRDSHNVITSILTVATDITRQVQASAAIQASEQRLQSLIDESPMAIAVYAGRDMVIELANDAILGFWGKSRSVIGLPLQQALPELEGQPFLQQLDDVYITGTPYHAWEAPATLEINGQLVRSHFNFAYKPLFDAQGQVHAILNVATNVEESVQYRQQLQESEDRYRQLAEQLEARVQQRTHDLDTMNDALRRSNDNLQQFAYIASHDLQEPLRKIQQFSDLLINNAPSQQGTDVDYLRRMQSAASRMATLIKDLLYFSRIDTTNHRELNEHITIGPLLTGIEEDLSLTIQESEARIEIDSMPTVMGDESQLRQLFQNLLTNAIKFRKPNTHPLIRITCDTVLVAALPDDLVPASRAEQYYCIGVEDNGIGFDEKYRSRIFQVFQRLHTQNQYQGTGIGLAICEKVATNHGGAIRALSRPGQGARFEVYLPVIAPSLASIRR